MSTAAPEKNRENKTVSVSGFNTNSTSGSSSAVSVSDEESTTRPTKGASSDVPAKTVKGQIIFGGKILCLEFYQKTNEIISAPSSKMGQIKKGT